MRRKVLIRCCCCWETLGGRSDSQPAKCRYGSKCDGRTDEILLLRLTANRLLACCFPELHAGRPVLFSPQFHVHLWKKNCPVKKLNLFSPFSFLQLDFYSPKNSFAFFQEFRNKEDLQRGRFLKKQKKQKTCLDSSRM